MSDLTWMDPMTDHRCTVPAPGHYAEGAEYRCTDPNCGRVWRINKIVGRWFLVAA